MRKFNRHQDPDLAPHGVAMVRQWGGVLEHPAHSLLFRHCRMPQPGELPDEHGGWTLAVDQCDLGHVARKPTWIYVVGLTPTEVQPRFPKGVPTHRVARDRRRTARGELKECSRRLRRYTPEPFAHFLIGLARASRQP
jgi:hypothetical protein